MYYPQNLKLIKSVVSLKNIYKNLEIINAVISCINKIVYVLNFNCIRILVTTVFN